jgi:hypothetical protein
VKCLLALLLLFTLSGCGAATVRKAVAVAQTQRKAVATSISVAQKQTTVIKADVKIAEQASANLPSSPQSILLNHQLIKIEGEIDPLETALAVAQKENTTLGSDIGAVKKAADADHNALEWKLFKAVTFGHLIAFFAGGIILPLVWWLFGAAIKAAIKSAVP